MFFVDNLSLKNIKFYMVVVRFFNAAVTWQETKDENQKNTRQWFDEACIGNLRGTEVFLDVIFHIVFL